MPVVTGTVRASVQSIPPYPTARVSGTRNLHIHDVAMVANNLPQLQAAMKRMSQLSEISRLKVSRGKTNLYHWSSRPLPMCGMDDT